MVGRFLQQTTLMEVLANQTSHVTTVPSSGNQADSSVFVAFKICFGPFSGFRHLELLLDMHELLRQLFSLQLFRLSSDLRQFSKRLFFLRTRAKFCASPPRRLLLQLRSLTEAPEARAALLPGPSEEDLPLLQTSARSWPRSRLTWNAPVQQRTWPLLWWHVQVGRQLANARMALAHVNPNSTEALPALVAHCRSGPRLSR